MNHIQGFSFFRDATAAGESPIFVSHVYTDATIEVKGDASEFEIEVQGCLDRESPESWTTLCMIDESDLKSKLNITANGIYSFSAMGKSVRVKINSISGGAVTVTGMFLN